MNKLPKHIAIIMDGNGRWARQRNLPRVMGHRSGSKAVDAVVEACARRGVQALTLYTFSTENWKRPREEIDALMSMLSQALHNNSDRLEKNNIKFNVIGRIGELSGELREQLDRVRRCTEKNTGMLLTLALNYGGRQEILDAVKAVSREVSRGAEDVPSWHQHDFEKFLYTAGMPDPDLVIRTSGEMRISNFLLWQSAYSEFYFTDTLWPDFNESELQKALDHYASRERRFGG